ncbi:MAG TPA: DinB family protein [Gemmatimonadaceae bacterium]|nr:DinB family protein [Gemmatimonadaceae bacterium]
MTTPPEPLCARRLRAAIATAEPMLRAMSDAAAARAPAPGKWSPKQVIGHLIDSATNNHQRFVRAAFQDTLVFPGYAQDDWVALQRYGDAAWDELLTFWLAYNRHIATIMAAVPEEARLRVRATHNLDEIATHAPPTAAHATLDYFMLDYVDHLELHLRQILGERWPSA